MHCARLLVQDKGVHSANLLIKISILIVITVTMFFIQKIVKLLNLFQLSEMTADLGEEHSIATTVANERLEVEQSEKMKIEKDRGELQVKATRYSKSDSHVRFDVKIR